jgi:hypothetical protein
VTGRRQECPGRRNRSRVPSGCHPWSVGMSGLCCADQRTWRGTRNNLNNVKAGGSNRGYARGVSGRECHGSWGLCNRQRDATRCPWAWCVALKTRNSQSSGLCRPATWRRTRLWR